MSPDTEVHGPTLVSRREAARLAGVSYNGIRLWEKQGRLHAVKMENGHVMYPISELEAIVKERRQEEGDPEIRLVKAEAENEALHAEIELLKDTLTQLRTEHEELLRTVIELARREPPARG